MEKTDQQIQNEHIRNELLLLNWNDIFNADIYERITVNAQRRIEVNLKDHNHEHK